MIFERIKKTQSELEIRFLEDCATAGLVVEPQFRVGNIHADFAVPHAKLVIECDSKKHHSSESEKENDRKRDEIYLAHGYAVIRISGPDIYKHGEKIAEDIKLSIFRGEIEPGFLYYPDSDYDDEDL